MNHNNMLKVFSGRANIPLAEKIAQCLNDSLGKVTLANFPDGEISVRIEEDVRGRDIFLVQPTCTPVNENLMELLIMLDTFKRASAARITAVLPYYGYARQDRKDVGRVPITAKLVANLLTTAGANRVLALDLHAAQIQGFFDIPVDHLHAAPVIDHYIRSLEIPPRDLVVLCPDEGSIKRALVHQKRIGAPLAIVDKRRSSASEVRSMNLIGASLEGKVAVIFDDMIATAGSVVLAANVARYNGAREVYACATHAVLCGPAIDRLRDAPIKQVVVTNSIPLPPNKQLPNIKVLDIAPLLADAIRRIHYNESVSKLFE
ncbi:MAG TPA: ribose-phosphate pyrophosphokinase [Gemmataceae bacterium]|nr:ribose-phosphate pyrophosphokinase [Gemmataceae bacterium]